MVSVRPANLPHLFHDVNNLGLQPGDLGGGESGLPEAGGQGGAAGLKLLAAEVLQGLAGDGGGVGRRASEEEGGEGGLGFG